MYSSHHHLGTEVYIQPYQHTHFLIGKSKVNCIENCVERLKPGMWVSEQTELQHIDQTIKELK